ncbi:MAG: TRAM domain-containing protein [Terrimicrobiaceae bacterium]
MENARLIITKVAFGGSGLGTLPAGKVCFVPYVIPGEVVTARIVRDKKSYAEARL